MKSFRRTDRLNHLLRDEISGLIRSSLKDPRVRTAIVTEVVTSPDLSHSTVYVRTLDEEVEPDEAVRGLDSAAGFIRRELGRTLHIRKVPEFHFTVDRTLERAGRIEGLLRQVREERGERPGD